MIAQVPKGIPYDPYIEVMIVYSKRDFMDDAMLLAERLRDRYIAVEVDLRGTSLRSQMKAASKRGYKYVLILGDEEVANKKVSLRDMDTGEQEMVNVDVVADILLERRSINA